ncbi:MAG: cyanophycin synthetase, partial [Spirochaetota bacterium]|nr:cyanophycin synthetase [Spirochaetota bacterium]
TDNRASMQAFNIKGSGQEADFSLFYNNTEYNVHLNLPKIFNVENSMAALLSVLKATTLDIFTFLPFMDRLVPAEGRMISVNMGQEFDVLVDYAHSPGSFELLFPALREMTKGKLISVFGSAGERDVSKRSVQGSIADKYSDIIVLTDEDPRGDNPGKILKDIASGCPGRGEGKNLFLIENRKDAIGFAFELAGKDDLVALLGKGHESSIIYKDGPIPWKEKDAAVLILKEMGFNKLSTLGGQK